MKFYTHLILAVAALFLIAACGSDDDTPQTVTSTGDNITGAWTTGCLGSPLISNNLGTLNFAGSGGSFSGITYLSDATCSTADTTKTESFTWTFTGTKTVSGLTVSKVDTTDTAANVTANTAAGAVFVQSLGGYGFSDWAAGVSHDILGVAIDGTTDPTTEKNIIYINTAVTPNTLQSGTTEYLGGAVDGDGYPLTLGPSSFHR